MFKFNFKKVGILNVFKASLCKVYYKVMSQIVPYICEQMGGIQINCIVDDGEPLFRAIDVAMALKYTRTEQIIRMHVADDEKHEQGSFDLTPLVLRGLKGDWEMTKYINESGLCCLIFGSTNYSNIGLHA